MNAAKLLSLLTSGLILIPSSSALDTIFSCPDNTTTAFCADIPQNSSTLLSISKKYELLLLSKVLVDAHEGGTHSIVPVGRSYHGFQWDRVPGTYVRLNYNCSTSISDGVCSVTLPELSNESEKFVLSRFVHKLTRNQKIARFLERVTFGTIRKDLNKLKVLSINNNNNFYETFGHWVHQQIEEVPPTSHRSFFRRHVSPRYNSRKPRLEGRIKHPCEAGARWRFAAFSLQDLQKNIVISKTSTNKYLLSIDGHPRTVVDDIIFKEKKDGIFELNTPSSTHRICASGEARVAAGMGIRYNNYCPRFKEGCPPADISDMQPQPLYVLNGLDPSTFTVRKNNENDTLIELMMSTKDIFDEHPGFCSLNFDFDTPIFTKLTNGQTMMFDSMLKLETNDLDSPLQSIADFTNAINDESYSRCPNVPRSFLNDQHCKLTNVPVCNPEKGLDLSLELNEENLRRLNQLTGRYYYIIEGLRLGENNAKNEDLPCSELAMSRWVKVSSDKNCETDAHKKTSSTYSFNGLLHIIYVTCFLHQI